MNSIIFTWGIYKRLNADSFVQQYLSLHAGAVGVYTTPANTRYFPQSIRHYLFLYPILMGLKVYFLWLHKYPSFRMWIASINIEIIGRSNCTNAFFFFCSTLIALFRKRIMNWLWNCFWHVGTGLNGNFFLSVQYTDYILTFWGQIFFVWRFTVSLHPCWVKRKKGWKAASKAMNVYFNWDVSAEQLPAQRILFIEITCQWCVDQLLTDQITDFYFICA